MRSQIPVYKAEASLGLADKIRTSGRIAYASVAEVGEPNLSKEYIQSLVNFHKELAAATNEGQEDLFYLKSILATVGWNKNDDVFDRIETWKARATPEDKPFNYEHNARDIIGHITANYVMDFKGNVIDDTAPLDDVPSSFHIATSSVLYRYWPDAELLKRMQQIIAEIPEGKWFVSMEALFNDFDYAVVANDGTNHVIARDEKTAFLTKHLRAYGGDGTFEGNKVGRLLRNMIFSGKGLVRRPANEHSIIFDTVTAFEKVIASSLEFLQSPKAVAGYTLGDRQHSNQESTVMAEPNTQVDLLQAEVKRLEQTLATVVAKEAEAQKQLHDMNAQTVQAKIDNLTNEIKSRDEKITTLTTQVETEQKARTEAETKVKQLETQVGEINTQINNVKAEQAKTKRVAVIVAELSKSQADAEKFYAEEVADLNMADDRFTKFIATLKAQKPADAGKTSSDTTASQTLDGAQAGKTAPLGTGDGVNNNVEQKRVALSSFLSNSFLHGKRAQKQTQE
jgi:hypothetical protein